MVAEKRILVTGADGQLGRELKLASVHFPQYDFIFTSRRELSIETPEEVARILKEQEPAICINCAAYTAVDKAQSHRPEAYRINAEAVGSLAAACKNTGTKLIHLSTDYVFDGTSAVPLKETDITRPINVYGASKLRGEELAFEANPETIIIRTSWVYSALGNNFVKTMMRLMNEQASISVINDQVGSPTWAANLASVILRIVDFEIFHPGIYHYSNEGKISWFEFAVAIKAITGSPCSIHPIPTSQFPSAAPRPAYSLLDKTKIKATYGIPIPGWKESLAQCIQQMKELGE